MIKQRNIDILNVDDYIRERKRLSRTRIFWHKESSKYLKKFAQTLLEIEGYESIRNYPIGYTFMGIKHFMSKK